MAVLLFDQIDQQHPELRGISKRHKFLKVNNTSSSKSSSFLSAELCNSSFIIIRANNDKFNFNS